MSTDRQRSSREWKDLSAAMQSVLQPCGVLATLTVIMCDFAVDLRLSWDVANAHGSVRFPEPAAGDAAAAAAAQPDVRIVFETQERRRFPAVFGAAPLRAMQTSTDGTVRWMIRIERNSGNFPFAVGVATPPEDAKADVEYWTDIDVLLADGRASRSMWCFAAGLVVAARVEAKADGDTRAVEQDTGKRFATNVLEPTLIWSGGPFARVRATIAEATALAEGKFAGALPAGDGAPFVPLPVAEVHRMPDDLLEYDQRAVGMRKPKGSGAYAPGAVWYFEADLARGLLRGWFDADGANGADGTGSCQPGCEYWLAIDGIPRLADCVPVIAIRGQDACVRLSEWQRRDARQAGK